MQLLWENMGEPFLLADFLREPSSGHASLFSQSTFVLPLLINNHRGPISSLFLSLFQIACKCPTNQRATQPLPCFFSLFGSWKKILEEASTRAEGLWGEASFPTLLDLYYPVFQQSIALQNHFSFMKLSYECHNWKGSECLLQNM